jgi:hypothetical protein
VLVRPLGHGVNRKGKNNRIKTLLNHILLWENSYRKLSRNDQKTKAQITVSRSSLIGGNRHGGEIKRN